MNNHPLNKRLFGEASWALFGQLGSAIALLAGIRILTEQVSPEVYGQVALFSGFVALGVALFAYPFICTGMRLLPECLHKRERAELQSVVVRLTIRSTALALIILAVAGGIYSYFFNDGIGLFVLAGFLLVVTVRREFGVQLLIGERRQREASLWQTIDSILRPCFAIALVELWGAKAGWVLFGYILASIVSNLIGSIIHGRAGDESPHPISVSSLKREIWAYALPLIPMELLYWVNGLGDRYIIGSLMTAADVGLYAASYTLINEAFNRSSMVLLRIFQPVYFQSVSSKDTKEGFNILWIWIACVAALGITGVTAIYFLKDWVAFLLLSKTYHEAILLMPAIGIGCALHALGTVLAQPLLAGKQTSSVLIGRLCGAVTAIIVIPVMVTHYGLLGAAMANPIYFGVEAIALGLLAKPWRINKTEHVDDLILAEEEI